MLLQEFFNTNKKDKLVNQVSSVLSQLMQHAKLTNDANLHQQYNTYVNIFDELLDSSSEGDVLPQLQQMYQEILQLLSPQTESVILENADVGTTVNQLEELVDQLSLLSNSAYKLINSLPREYDNYKDQAHAYGVYSFGYSSNMYDITFRSIVNGIINKYEKQGSDQDN